MKKNDFVFCLFLILSFVAFSQNSDQETKKDSYVTFTPWPLGDPYAPRWRFGYTAHVKNHFKIGVDVGYGTDETVIKQSNNLGSNYRLWELRPEFYYIINPEVRTLKYVSVELFYINHNDYFENGNYQSNKGLEIDYLRANYTRVKYGAHFKFGLFLDLTKHIGFNFYGGVGFRARENTYTNVINATENDYVFREWFTPLYEIEGSTVAFNPSLGIKLYYKL